MKYKKSRNKLIKKYREFDWTTEDTINSMITSMNSRNNNNNNISKITLKTKGLIHAGTRTKSIGFNKKIYNKKNKFKSKAKIIKATNYEEISSLSSINSLDDLDGDDDRHLSKLMPIASMGNEDEFKSKHIFDNLLFLPDKKQTPTSTVSRIPISGTSNLLSLCKQPKFGSCCMLKTFILVTICLSLVIFVIVDHCFEIDHFLSNSNPEQITTAETIISSSNDASTLTTEDIYRLHQSCPYKYAYVFFIFIGPFVYGTILVIYTCQIAVHFYNFPWYLLESILIFTYSLGLLITTVLAYIWESNIYVTNLSNFLFTYLF